MTDLGDRAASPETASPHEAATEADA